MSKGGTHEYKNIRAAHLRCNQKKNDNLELSGQTFQAMSGMAGETLQAILGELIEIKKELKKGRKTEGQIYPLFKGDPKCLN